MRMTVWNRQIFVAVCLFSSFFINTTAFAADAGTKANNIPSPLRVEYKKGLFDVYADDVPLQTVLSEIEKQSGVAVALMADNTAREKHVSIYFTGLDEKAAIWRIAGAAGLGGFAYSLNLTVSPDGKSRWTIDNVTMINKGGIESTKKKESAGKDGKELVLAAIDRFNKAVPKKTKYTISRKEYRDSVEIAILKSSFGFTSGLRFWRTSCNPAAICSISTRVNLEQTQMIKRAIRDVFDISKSLLGTTIIS